MRLRPACVATASYSMPLRPNAQSHFGRSECNGSVAFIALHKLCCAQSCACASGAPIKAGIRGAAAAAATPGKVYYQSSNCSMQFVRGLHQGVQLCWRRNHHLPLNQQRAHPTLLARGDGTTDVCTSELASSDTIELSFRGGIAGAAIG